MPHLIVIYGAPLTGKSSLAREVAGALEGKAAVVSADALLHDAIRAHDTNAYAELDMVYTQVRLLVANYLKSRYHVVLEGAFVHEIEGVVHGREQEIDQITGLMRNLAPSPLLVRLTASPETLRARSAASPRPMHVDAALRIDHGYQTRHRSRFIEMNSDARSVVDLANDVMDQLHAKDFL